MTLSLNKSIQGQRLHPRTGAPTTDPEATIPFGAILEYAGRDRDFDKYKYMGDTYRTKHDIFTSATNYSAVQAAEKASAVDDETEPAAMPAAAAAAPAEVAGPRLLFEPVPSNVAGLKRAKVPGGWLVAVGSACVTFYPDAQHAWNGLSAD